MKGLSKILSILLIVSACFGVFKSVEGIKDISSSKDYWEEKGAEASENFDKLDDGIAKLSDNEQAYLDGVDQVAQGENDLAKGKSDLAKGKSDLAAGKNELAKGKKDLAAGTKQYEAGKSELAAGKKDLADAEAAYGGEGVPVLKTVYDNVNSLMAPKSVDQAAAIAASSAGVPAEQLKQIYQGVAAGMQAGLSEDAAIDKVAAASAMSQVKPAYDAMKELVNGYSEDKAVAAVAAAAGKDAATVKAAYEGVSSGMKAGLTEDQAVLEAAFALVASAKGISAEDAKKLYNAAKTSGAATAAIGAVSAASGVPTAMLQQVYTGMLKNIGDGYSKEDSAALISANLGGTISAAEVLALYENVNATINSVNELVAAVDGNSPVIKSAFENVAGLMAPKSAAQAAAIAASSTGADAAQLEQIYTGVAAGMQAGLSEDAALEKVAAQAGRPQVSQAYNGVKDLVNGYSKDQAVQAVAKAAGMTAADIENAYAGYETYVAGQVKVAMGEKALTAAEKELAAGKAKLAAGEKSVADGEKAVAAGEAKLADGEAQLADGKSKLAEFEGGEAQLIDGLNTAIGTEGYPGVKAIADRLGNGFSFMKAGGKNVNLSAASEVVKAGRDFLADTEVRVTDELMPKLYGNIAVIIASILALLGGLLGLKGKFKAAGVAGGLSAVAAGAGVAFIKKAGVAMAKIAGSTILGTSLYAGAFVLLVVGAVHAVSNLATKKDAQ